MVRSRYSLGMAWDLAGTAPGCTSCSHSNVQQVNWRRCNFYCFHKNCEALKRPHKPSSPLPCATPPSPHCSFTWLHCLRRKPEEKDESIDWLIDWSQRKQLEQEIIAMKKLEKSKKRHLASFDKQRNMMESYLYIYYYILSIYISSSASRLS